MLNEITNECNCSEPYSGEFCEELKRERVLHYYNKKGTQLGAIGGLIILPLIILQWSCNALERRRKVKRVGKAIEDEMKLKRSAAQNQKNLTNKLTLDARIAESLLMRNFAREDDI
uniref:EGF-like domain-containing protein n=1 Tax=Syphacia muris TaxID=451379 RepID=A0A0N5ATJ3_9BILA